MSSDPHRKAQNQRLNINHAAKNHEESNQRMAWEKILDQQGRDASIKLGDERNPEDRFLFHDDARNQFGAPPKQERAHQNRGDET